MIPFYGAAYGMPVEAIVGMGQAIVPAVNGVWDFVLLITAPFNLFKWIVISVVTVLVYKPLSPILHGGRKRQRG
jgi:riboflavin transporter FmnP